MTTKKIYNAEMGSLHKLNRGIKNALQHTRMSKLSKEIQRLHASVPMATWQRERVVEIRSVYDTKCRQLANKHIQLQQSITEEFMEHEIEFIMASQRFRQDNPNKEWHPNILGKIGFTARTFWNKIIGISYDQKATN